MKIRSWKKGTFRPCVGMRRKRPKILCAGMPLSVGLAVYPMIFFKAWAISTNIAFSILPSFNILFVILLN